MIMDERGYRSEKAWFGAQGRVKRSSRTSANSEWSPRNVEPSHHGELSTIQQPSELSIDIASHHKAGVTVEKLELCEAEDPGGLSPIYGRGGRPTTSRSHVDAQETENVFVELETIGSAVIGVGNRACGMLPGSDFKAAVIIQSQRMNGTGGVSRTLGLGSTQNASRQDETKFVQVKAGEQPNASDDNLVDGVTHKERGRPTIASSSRSGTFNAHLGYVRAENYVGEEGESVDVRHVTAGGDAIPAHAEHQYLPISSTV
ncbi:hypothetical protein BKA70DRAFT_1235637 [Coprinopsis sp. MPI-PUGE-AT-0042]|nr:hypothetical protein BKA70DRAFT_1235637 [Coprinopsis sp. MPI-PUGE-AT-0042]